MPIILSIAYYCSRVFSSSLRLLTFYPSSMPLNVGDLQNQKCPCWLLVCFYCSHCRFPHTFSKGFPQTKPEPVKRKNPTKNSYSHQNPHIERTLPKVIPERFTKLPQCPKKQVHSFFPFWPPRKRVLSLAALLLLLGPDSPGMAFGIRGQILLVFHFTHPVQLLTLICFVFLKKWPFFRTFGVKMCHTPHQLTVRVLCICSTAQCKFVNTFFKFIFSKQGFV